MSTQDGGNTWHFEIMNNYLPSGTFMELDFNETGQGYASGYNGLLLKTQTQVGFQENKEDHNLMIYPNPATNHVYINSRENIGKISLYNELGELLYKNESVNRKSIKLNLTEYQSGIYFVKIDNSVHKLLKQLDLPR